MDAIEAMGAARAIRHYRPDPVPPELVDRVLWAATRACSPMNSQCWDFVVVRDDDQRRRLQEALSAFATSGPSGTSAADDDHARAAAGARHLAATFATVPVLIFVVGRLAYPPVAPQPRYTYSAVYAAAQNLVVAATSLGLGAAFTTLHELAEPAFRAILAIPDDRILAVSVPLGWPARGTGLVRRMPLEDVVHLERW